MSFFNFSTKYYQQLEKEIIELETIIADSPSGTLKIHKNGNSYKWYKQNANGKRKYLSKSSEPLAIALAVKAYATKRLAFLKREKPAIFAYLKRMEKTIDHSQALLTDSPEYSRLIMLGDVYNNEDIYKWAKDDYERNDSHPEHLNVKTVNGLYVRSKSEAFIALELASSRIPFRYECKLEFDDIVLYPDFTIKSPITGETILWEHLGMLDDNHYLEKALSKIRLYIKNGYIPSVNLIITCETKDKPLDFSTIRNMIAVHLKQ